MAELKELAGHPCTVHPGAVIVVSDTGLSGFCRGGTYDETHPKCKSDTLKALAASLNGHIKKSPPPKEYGGPDVVEREKPQNGRAPTAKQERPSLLVWKAQAFRIADVMLREGDDYKRAIPASELVGPLLRDIKDGLEIQGLRAPEGLSKTEIEEELTWLAKRAIESWAGGIDLDRALPAVKAGNSPIVQPERGVSKYAIGIGAPAISALRVYGADEFFKATDYLDEIEWCWDDIFPSTGLVGVFGDPEAGKSTFCRTFALAVSRGVPCLGRDTKKSNVLYLDLADEQLSHRRAFKALGWTGTDMKLVSQDSLIGNPNALDLVEAAIKELKSRVVVVDMMADLLTFRDLNDYANAKEALRGLRMLCRETSALFIVLHHTPKALGPDADVLKAGLGSQAIVGSFDLRIAIRRRAKDLSTIIMSNGKVGGKPITTEHALLRDVETEWTTLGEPWDAARKDYYAEKIHQYFTLQGPEERLTAVQIAESLDLNPGFIRASLRTLIRDRRLTREGEGKAHKPFYYRLPDWLPPQAADDARYKDN